MKPMVFLWDVITLDVAYDYLLLVIYIYPFNDMAHQLVLDRLENVICVNYCLHNIPESKVHGANMGPIWDRQGPGGPHVGPMNFAIWDSLPRITSKWINILKVPIYVLCVPYLY